MTSFGAKGIDIKVLKNWDLTKEAVIAAAMKGQRKLAANILGESQKLVPRISGTLARSGHISTDKSSLTTTISYNTPYARRIHEGGVIEVKGYSVKECDVKEYTINNFMGKGKSITIKAHKRKAHTVSGYKTSDIKGAKYLERPFNEKSGQLTAFVEDEIVDTLIKEKYGTKAAFKAKYPDLNYGNYKDVLT